MLVPPPIGWVLDLDFPRVHPGHWTVAAAHLTVLELRLPLRDTHRLSLRGWG